MYLVLQSTKEVATLSINKPIQINLYTICYDYINPVITMSTA